MAEPRPEPRETREYGFEEGVAESVRRILELAEREQRDLVVVISGSDINVGKSRVKAAIERELMARDIWTANILALTKAELESRRDVLPDLEGMQKRPHSVFFFTTHSLSTRAGVPYNELRADALPVDFTVAVYRPDKPFDVPKGLELVADVVIRNEFAVDK